jgi:hypothetical protein
MTRISLVEQYNNKDVITQIYDVKDRLDASLDNLEDAIDTANAATDAANLATQAANNAVNTVNQVETRTGVLETYVGSPSDTASATGSLYARSKKNANDITANTNTITTLSGQVGANTTDIGNIKPVIQGLPTNYQEKSQKDALNGYAGLSSAGKIATSQIDTGVALNQILKAGAQLNTGEVLYVGPGGVIRSRIIGEGVEYVGNYASLAALQAYPSPQNGDFGTVYGTVSDDGMYMYDGANWNFVMLFDATDYELVANKVTGISSASTDDQYPSAKAVYDYDVANDVASVLVGETTSSGKVTVSVTLSNANATTIATDSVDIPTTDTPTASSNVPITSGGVKDAIDTVNGNITTAVSGKQDTLTSTTITLATANWSSNAQTVTGISNVTATNIVWVSPSAVSMDEYGQCGIRVTAQGSGSLTFETNGTTPSNNLTVIVVGA